MRALSPVTTRNLEVSSLAEVSHGAQQSFIFPHHLSMDIRPCSGFVISTLENLFIGLAA
jgi:hypothetical protein